MRYHYGAEARLRRSIENAVMTIFEAWNYEEIATPAIDYYALFERGMGADAAQHAFRFADSDGALLALRPDVTSTIARAAATLLCNRPRPLRLCYAASVWRTNTRSGAEWRREGKHLGCEFIGAENKNDERVMSDLEMLSIIVEIIERLNLQDSCRITLNNVRIFNGIAERLQLEKDERERMRRLMDLRDSTALQNFLAARTSSDEDAAAFGRLVRMTGKGEMFEAARAIISNQQSIEALDELESLWNGVTKFKLAECFEIDLGDASQLDYYTGVVFKIYVAGAGTRIGSGGRYDDLIKLFGRADSAIGFMLDLDSLTDVLMKRKLNQHAFAASQNDDNSALEIESA